MKKITIEQIKELSLTQDDTLSEYIVEDGTRKLKEWFFSPPGKEHYTLIASLSHCVNDSVLYDIGTFRGSSALALSSNKTNRVVTYDIVNYLTHKLPENVEFKIGNYKEDEGVLSSPLIVFDCDPHDGKLEREVIDFLEKNKYNGTILFDDIHLNDKMKEFWNSIKQEKYDVTDKGHWSGTGIVFF
jgi:hypothetical protein